MTVPLSRPHPAHGQMFRRVPLVALLAEVITRHRIRRSLGGLNAEMLRDIGLTPHDLNMALGLPMSRDAADALDRAALGTPPNW